MSARNALAEIDMKTLRLGPRYGLGLVNGTAASAATTGLAMPDTIQLTLLSAGLTCFVSEIRPPESDGCIHSLLRPGPILGSER